MSELRDTLKFLEAVDARLDEQDKRDAAGNAKFTELERQLAVLDRGQFTMNNQLEVFRTAINEGFERIRRELRGKH